MGMQYADHDTSLAGSFQLQFKNGSVEFQFPPVVQTDKRTGTWKPGAMHGKEPIAVFATTDPRVFNISIVYIVDGGQWDSNRIAQQLRLLRGYYLLTDTGSDQDLVAQVKMWAVGGNSLVTCRLESTSIKYSETIVGQGDNAFPLRTEVIIDLRLWTKGGGVQQVDGLLGELPQDWY